MKWIKHDGYNETHQYVDATGRIMAEVCGNEFERESGWYALDQTTFPPPTHLGRYVSLGDAKSAVIERLTKQ